MGFFSNETSWAEIASSLGVTEAYAKRLKALMDSMPLRCALCGQDTLSAYLLRLADAESPKHFGAVQDPKNCKVAMQRICRPCISEIGGVEEMADYFKAQAARGNAVDLGR